MSTTITLDAVARIAGVKPQLLRDWVAAGLVTPAVPGGKNRSHRFGYMQAIGVAVAARVRASPRGCVTGYVGEVVRAFEAVPDTWLWGRFVKSRTHLATVHQGRPLLDGARYDWVDVQEVHRQVLRAMAAVDRISNNPAPTSESAR